MSTIQEQLTEHLENGKDWEKLDTPINGVFIVKVPKNKSRDAKLYMEIKPLNQYGSSLKKKGIFVSNSEIFVNLGEAIADEKIFLLIYILEDINNNANSNLNSYDEEKAKIRDQLLNHLKSAETWEKMVTPIRGVWVVKSPSKRFQKSKLYIEIKPVDEFGKPLNRKGLFISSKIELITLGEALLDDHSFQLIKIMNQINDNLSNKIDENNTIIIDNDVHEISGEETEAEDFNVELSEIMPEDVESVYDDLISFQKEKIGLEGDNNIHTLIDKLKEALNNYSSDSESDEPEKRYETQNLIYNFELRIRKFIKTQLKKIYGDNWWTQGVSTNIREAAEERLMKKQRIEPRRSYVVIDFLNFKDYSNIIL
ncbi:MAG: hypothetical protein EU535_07515, partial [Promethearchaeota archaeon]